MRSAHEAVGKLVRECEQRKCRLADLPDAMFDAVVPGRERNARHAGRGERAGGVHELRLDRSRRGGEAGGGMGVETQLKMSELRPVMSTSKSATVQRVPTGTLWKTTEIEGLWQRGQEGPGLRPAGSNSP